MDDGDNAYEAGEPDEEAELGFVGALEGEGSAEGEKEKKKVTKRAPGAKERIAPRPVRGALRTGPRQKLKLGLRAPTKWGFGWRTPAF